MFKFFLWWDWMFSDVFWLFDWGMLFVCVMKVCRGCVVGVVGCLLISIIILRVEGV